MTFRTVTAILGLSLLGVAPTAAEAPLVTIVEPPAGLPVFGQLPFSVDVISDEPIEAVELWLDGALVAELDAPPYRTDVDVGDVNAEHRFEARARSRGGEVGEALLVTPAIRVDEVVAAELQQLYVTVTRDGRRILDLEESDFAIVDDGEIQDLVTFARGDVRVTSALLIDSSTSMAGARLRHALRGAMSFVGSMREIDDSSILLFADRLLHETPFSNDPAVLTDQLGNVSAVGGTALYDHLYLALKRLETRQGRKVLVLLTDGVDSHSALTAPEVQWLARRSRALVYWIRTGGELKKRYSGWKDPAAYITERRLLNRIVQESGGRVVDIDQIQDAEAAFDEILAELREQYVLGYYPSNSRNDGSWHRITVRLRPSGLDLRTQKGYVDY
ncbi:MAG: VWA domain-containing protein [Acidobacteriota bacterium]